MVAVVVLDNDEVFLRNNQVFAIDLAEDVRLQDIGRRPCGVEAGLEEHETVHSRTDHIDIMGDQEDCQAQLFVQMLHQLDDIVLRRNIQSGRRLIEQQHIWLLGQGSSDEDPLLLSSGEVA